MKPFILILLCALYAGTGVQAQYSTAQSARHLFYRISSDNARKMIAKPEAFDTLWLHDTLLYADRAEHLPPGHYLQVFALGETLKISLHSVAPFEVHLLDTERDFAFTVTDTSGRRLTNASAWLDGKKVLFNPKMQCYRLPRREKGGLLEVKHNGLSLFYVVETQKHYPSIRRQRWQRFTMHPPGRIVGVAYYKLRNAWWLARHPRYLRRHQWFKVFRRERHRSEGFGGYMTFSKPIYRPGDTLRLQAWVTSPKGRPRKRPLIIRITDNRQYREILRDTLYPEAPGAYAWEKALQTPFLLDRSFTVILEEQNPYQGHGLFWRERYPLRMQHSFSYEDYVLDEVKWAFSATQPTYYAGDTVRWNISARDANGHGQSDGYYKIIIRSVSQDAFYAPEVQIPDTLWRTEGPMNAQGEVTIDLPVSAFPPVRGAFEANAFCTNGAGELQQLNVQFRADHRPEEWIVRAEKGWLNVDWKDTGSRPKQVVLYRQYIDLPNRVDTLPLPVRMKLEPTMLSLQCQANHRQLYLNEGNYPELSHRVSAKIVRSDDGVAFTLTNPHGIPLQYYIYRGADLWKTGSTTDSLWSLTESDMRHHFTLKAFFLWGGASQMTEAESNWMKKLLHVSIEQPADAAPGDPVNVKVQVKNQRRRPVKNAVVTSGAYNSLFGGSRPYSLPQITGRAPKPALQYNPFTATPPDRVWRYLPLTEKWYRQLHLDTILYYQLRFKALKEGVTVYETPIWKHIRGISPAPQMLPDLPKEQDLFYYEQPQFVPMVTHEFQSEPIYLVWLNGELVWYHGNTVGQPFCFFGRIGENHIRVRTRTREYRLDHVEFSRGNKYILALNDHTSPDLLRSATQRNVAELRAFQKANLYIEGRPDSLTIYEQQHLRNVMLLLRPSSKNTPQYIWSNRYFVYQTTSSRSPFHIVGPFLPHNPVHLAQKDRWITQFSLDPGFEYEIYSQRERLYAGKWPLGLGHFPKNTAAPPIHEWAWGPHIVTLSTPPPPARVAFLSPVNDSRGTASLRWHYAVKDSLVAGVALRRDSIWMGPWNSAVLNAIPPGAYTFLLFTQKGTVIEKKIFLQRDTLLYLDLSLLPARPPRSGEQFTTLFPPIMPPPPANNGGAVSLYSRPAAPGWGYGTVIEGTIKDDTGETLIGAVVKVFQNGILISGVVTNIDGFYRISVPPGKYDLEVSYTGYASKTINDLDLNLSNIQSADVTMEASTLLQEVVISGYAAGLRVQDLSQSVSTTSLQSMAPRQEAVAQPLSDATDTRLGDTASEDDPVRVRSDFRDHAWLKGNLRTDRRGEVQFTATFPDNLTTWNSYAFAGGKRGQIGLGHTFTRTWKPLTAELAVPRFAVAGDRFDMAGRVRNRRDDSLQVQTRFYAETELLQEKQHRIGSSLTEYATFTAPAQRDSLQLVYEMRSGAQSDGERRSIPLLPAGIVEHVGEYITLTNDSIRVIHAPDSLGMVTLRVEAGGLSFLLEDIDYLRRYPYGCNEQTSSRLQALLVLKKIKAKQQLPFEYETDIAACIERLLKGQFPDGSWGWWPGGTTNRWMTIYVTRALMNAHQSGYYISRIDEALGYLRLHLMEMNLPDRQATVQLLRERYPNFECPSLLEDVPPHLETVSDKLSFLALRYYCGVPVKSSELRELMQPNLLGGWFCGVNRYDWYNSHAPATWQAWELARKAGWTDIQTDIEDYWLSARPAQGNTINTARIIEALWDKISNTQQQAVPPKLLVNGEEISRFPAVRQLSPGDISVVRQGSVPLFVGYSQKFINPAPAPKSDVFEVKTALMSPLKDTLTSLTYGEKALMQIAVTVRAAADYVMVEAPIPASCTYGAKEQTQYYWSQPERYREYFKDRVSIFCEHITPGIYYFTVELEPRFTGTFTLNPAKAELMYFPTFYGRNAGRTVLVKR